MRKSAALILAGGLATAAVTAIPEAEARPWGWRGGYGGYPPSNAYRSYYSTSYGWGYGNAYWASSKQVRKAARKGRR